MDEYLYTKGQISYKAQKEQREARTAGRNAAKWALEIGEEALEKQIVKKIEVWNGQCSCPACKHLYGNASDIEKLSKWEYPYCKYCGQALDWSGIRKQKNEKGKKE